MTDRLPTPPTAHAGHDLLLVAAFAADDVEAAERTAAEALLASCAECTELAADLRAISRATAELPAAVRRRDFTLRPADAARLRPLGWRRLAAALGARRLDVSRPLAAGLTTLGLAGLLISGLPLLSLGSSAGAAPSAASAAAATAAAPSGDTVEKAGEPEASAAPSGPVLTDRGAAVPAPSATGRDDRSGAEASGAPSATNAPLDYLPAGSPRTAAGGGAGASTTPPPDDAVRSLASGAEPGPRPNLPLGAVSAGLLVLGLALFALRRATKNAGGA